MVLHEVRTADRRPGFVVRDGKQTVAVARPVPGGPGGYILTGYAMCWLDPRARQPRLTYAGSKGVTEPKLMWIKSVREVRRIMSGLAAQGIRQ